MRLRDSIQEGGGGGLQSRHSPLTTPRLGQKTHGHHRPANSLAHFARSPFCRSPATPTAYRPLAMQEGWNPECSILSECPGVLRPAGHLAKPQSIILIQRVRGFRFSVFGFRFSVFLFSIFYFLFSASQLFGNSDDHSRRIFC